MLAGRPVMASPKRSQLTSGTAWLNDADAASVVTDRVAMEMGAAILVRRGTALGTRRALDNMASAEGASVSIERKEDVRGEDKNYLSKRSSKNRGVECPLSLLVGQI